MKLKLLLKTMALTSLFILMGYTGWGQVLLEENFDYTEGTFLTANGWTAHSGAGNTPISVVSPGLSFSGYASSGIGLAAWIDDTGEDVNRTFTQQTTGVVYASFIMKADATNSAGYFLNFGPSTIGTTFFTRVWVNGTGSGIGIGQNAPASYIPITAGNSYLIVIKYDVTSKISSLFVFSYFPTTEPVTADQTYTETATIPNLGSIALRQYNAAQDITVDGIRVATTWADAVAKDVTDAIAPTKTFNPANAATGVLIADNLTISYDEAIRMTDNTEITNANVGSLITLRETDGTGTVVPFTASINAFKKIITINPDADLKNGQLYYLAIADVEDLNNNASTGSNITFTTVDAATPILSNVAITETAPYFAGDNVTVTWTSENVDNVKIELWNPVSSAWSDLAATTASDGSESVQLDAGLLYSTGYKVRVSYITDAQVNAESATFAVIATPTIAAIQSNMSDGDRSVYNGQIVRINGIVTAKKASGSGYFVQSGSGANTGIYVFGAVSAVTVGDNVTIQGTVTEYQNTNSTGYLTEITSPTVVVNSQGNTLPAITTITTGQLTEAYEGVLIKIINAEVKTDPHATFYDFTIDDGSGVTTVDDDFYRYTATVGQKLTISGAGYFSYSLFKILPLSAADVQSADATVSSTVYTVDNTAGSITNIAYSETLANFKTNLTPAANATFNVYDSDGLTAATTLDDTKKVIVMAQDGITSKTYTITRNAVRTEKAILSFNFTNPSVTGVVNANDHTVTLLVPPATDVSNLVPTITVSGGASISPLTGVAQNFTNSVTYTVTAEDLTTQEWIVTVNIARTGKSILTFDFTNPAVTGVVNADNHTVTLLVPPTTNVSNLVPTITISAGASISPLSGVAQNFTTPVTYTVTAEDLTTQDWVVTVNVARTGTDILTFSFATPAATGTVNTNNHTVAVTVPNGTNVTALIPTITVSDGATISPLSGVAQNFTNVVNYTVTAEDQTNQVWAVTVTIATGIEDGLTSNFKIYPNPFMEEIKFEGVQKTFKVEIYNQTGQLMLQKQININDNRVSTTNLKSGLYFINLIDEKGNRLTEKMIKK